MQKFVGNNRPAPKFLKKYGSWIIDALFIFITWSDHVFGVVKNPVGSGVWMLTLTTGVVFSGAFWERRTFCRHVCFLGALQRALQPEMAARAQSIAVAVRGDGV